jgi:hypothetical protein
MVKKDEIDLGMVICLNVAFNGNGRMAVVVRPSSKLMVIEIGRNETSPE